MGNDALFVGYGDIETREAVFCNGLVYLVDAIKFYKLIVGINLLVCELCREEFF